MRSPMISRWNVCIWWTFMNYILIYIYMYITSLVTLARLHLFPRLHLPTTSGPGHAKVPWGAPWSWPRTGRKPLPVLPGSHEPWSHDWLVVPEKSNQQRPPTMKSILSQSTICWSINWVNHSQSYPQSTRLSINPCLSQSFSIFI